MNKDLLRIKWESLVYDIEYKLDKKVHYDTSFSKNLIQHCSINKLFKNCNEELLKHDADYWVALIYEERKFILGYLEAYTMLKDCYNIPDDIAEILKVNYFSKDYKDNLFPSSSRDIVDKVLVQYYGTTNTSIFKIGKRTRKVIQEFAINYIIAKNPAEARLKAEKEFGFIEKLDEDLFTGEPVYVFVEQILDIDLEYNNINNITTDMNANIKLKNRLKERLDALVQELD